MSKYNTLKNHQVVKLVNYLQSKKSELNGLKDLEVAAQCTEALGFEVCANNIQNIRTTPDYECTWVAYGKYMASSNDADINMLARELIYLYGKLGLEPTGSFKAFYSEA